MTKETGDYILDEIIPKVLTDINNDDEYCELYQFIALDYLEEKAKGKWEGKEIGYIKNSLNNRKMDYFRIIKPDEKNINREMSQAIHSEYDYRGNFIKISEGNRKQLQYNTDYEVEMVLDYYREFIKSEYNLFPTNIPFSQWRKTYNNEIIFTDKGMRYLQSIEDKVRIKIPDTYKDNIVFNNENKNNPVKKIILKNLKEKGIVRYDKAQDIFIVNVKKLFFDYLDRFSEYTTTDWDIRPQFTYKGHIKIFCDTYKYNGIATLNRYAKEYRNKTGILAEYFFYSEVKRAIKEIYDKAEKSYRKDDKDLPVDCYPNQTNICKVLNLKINHSKIITSLEYMVYSQQIKYIDEAQTYRVLK
ncbi:MAG: hypothetical protein HN982_07215 [Candidatus Marinimicrobia bacterium]|jgi:hypothetical protein|nr:hypothetical protein [Candidatus Neomarinimicrobiota bacterium]MBT6937356.1 hypothetical protein [Candidatus Neomarinimicrobiota bacterium]MBT7901198.1 hypothetical protein [Candidatus Neomarinimicrobiota bacterium]